MLSDLLERNRAWSAERTGQEPGYFTRLAVHQAPEFFWIGCSDSRVPANDIVGLDPGELFVHRNVANLVIASDLNLLAVLQFAVEMLSVSHIIVCGHYGCGGVRAALGQVELGISDNWLQPLRQLRIAHTASLQSLDQESQLARLCEINVVQQAHNVAATTIVQDAWSRGRSLSVHGWIYALEDGRLQDLGCTLSRPDQLEAALRVQPPGGVSWA